MQGTCAHPVPTAGFRGSISSPTAALAFYGQRGPWNVRDEAGRQRKMEGFQNALRFHKMFVDAGLRQFRAARRLSRQNESHALAAMSRQKYNV